MQIDQQSNEIQRNQKILELLLMQLGPAIAIFIVVSIVLMGLFCVVTKYFNYKLRKAIIQQNQTYSLVQGIQGERQDINEGQYEDFVIKRIKDRKQRELAKTKNYKIMIEMADLNISQLPLQNDQQNIYEAGRLKRRLQQEIVPSVLQTTRSLVSAKMFKPAKLGAGMDNSFLPRMNTLASQKESLQNEIKNFNEKSSRQQNQSQNATLRRNNTPNITFHKYINKIISYTQKGFTIITKKVVQVWKQQYSEQIKQNSLIEKNHLIDGQLGFDNAIEASGFQRGIFQACKYVTSIQIVNMKPNLHYSINSLKKSQKKQLIQFSQFQEMAKKFQVKQ